MAWAAYFAVGYYCFWDFLALPSNAAFRDEERLVFVMVALGQIAFGAPFVMVWCVSAVAGWLARLGSE